MATNETWLAGPPITVGSIALLPIARMQTRSACERMHGWYSATKEPFALVVRVADGIRVVATGGQPVVLADLRERIPELDVLLASM